MATTTKVSSMENIATRLAELQQQTLAKQEEIRLKREEIARLRNGLATQNEQEQRAAQDLQTFASEMALRNQHVDLVAGEDAELVAAAVQAQTEGKEHMAVLQKRLRDAREASAAEEMRVSARETQLNAEIDEHLTEMNDYGKESRDLQEIQRRHHTSQGHAKMAHIKATFEKLEADRVKAREALSEAETGLAALYATIEREMTDWPDLRREALQLCAEFAPGARTVGKLLAFLDSLHSDGRALKGHLNHPAMQALTIDPYTIEQVLEARPKHLDGTFELKREAIEAFQRELKGRQN